MSETGMFHHVDELRHVMTNLGAKLFLHFAEAPALAAGGGFFDTNCGLLRTPSSWTSSPSGDDAGSFTFRCWATRCALNKEVAN